MKLQLHWRVPRYVLNAFSSRVRALRNCCVLFCASVQYAPVRPTPTRLPDYRTHPGFLGETVEVVDFTTVVVVVVVDAA